MWRLQKTEMCHGTSLSDITKHLTTPGTPSNDTDNNKNNNSDNNSNILTHLVVGILFCVCCWIYMMTSSNGNIFRVTGHLCGEFTGHRWITRTQRPVTRNFDVFFDLRLNKRLSKQSWGWWLETPSRPLWRHCNDLRESTMIGPLCSWWQC